MLVSVTERTREIASRMAGIRWQFLIKTLILALIGGLVGALFRTSAAVAIVWKAGWSILISPRAIVSACDLWGSLESRLTSMRPIGRRGLIRL